MGKTAWYLYVMILLEALLDSYFVVQVASFVEKCQVPGLRTGAEVGKKGLVGKGLQMCCSPKC